MQTSQVTNELLSVLINLRTAPLRWLAEGSRRWAALRALASIELRAKSGVCATLPLPQCRVQLWHESAIVFGLSANKRHKSTLR